MILNAEEILIQQGSRGSFEDDHDHIQLLDHQDVVELGMINQGTEVSSKYVKFTSSLNLHADGELSPLDINDKK